MNAAFFSVSVLVTSAIFLLASCSREKIFGHFAFSILLVMTFLMGIARGNLIGTDTTRYIDWLQESIQARAFDHTLDSRFEPGFVIITNFLGAILSPEVAISLASSVTFTLSTLVTFLISRQLGFTRLTSVFAAIQVPLWFFHIDLSFNALRSAIANTTILFSLFAVMREKYLLGGIIAISAVAFHLSSLPIILILALIISRPNTSFFSIMWVIALAVQIGAKVKIAIAGILMYLPLPSHQISFLINFDDANPTNLIGMSALFGIISIGLAAREKDYPNRRVIFLYFLASNALFLLLAEVAFSYRWSYFSFSMVPILLAYLIDRLAPANKILVALIFLAFISVLNYSMFGFIRGFYGMEG